MNVNGVPIVMTRSRLQKGLIAIPSGSLDLFPRERTEISVLLDDSPHPVPKTFIPDDSRAKESRIFGLAGWFSQEGLAPGDVVYLMVVNREEHLYRLISERRLRHREAEQVRRRAESATTEAEATQSLEALAQITRRRGRDLAAAELRKLLRSPTLGSRASLPPSSGLHHASANYWVRALIGEIYAGRCQVCSFTFTKRDGQPYFEIHHIDPEVGDDPRNLLLLCANCHRKFTYAEVTCPEYQDRWLVAVKINGARVRIKQKFTEDPIPPSAALAAFLVTVLSLQSRP